MSKTTQTLTSLEAELESVGDDLKCEGISTHLRRKLSDICWDIVELIEEIEKEREEEERNNE